MPKRVDISIIQGQTFRQRYGLRAPDDVNVLQPIDLSDMVATGEIRELQRDDAPLLAEFAFDLSEAETGFITAVLPASITKLITRDGYYDIFLTAGTVTPERLRIISGSVKLDRKVTL